MPDYQQRVLDEKKELDERLAKLREFIDHSAVFSTLVPEDRLLLYKQRNAMAEYSSILQQRIDRFEA